MFRSQRIAVEAYQLVSARIPKVNDKSKQDKAQTSTPEEAPESENDNKKPPSKTDQKYLSYARSFPTLVHTSGLSQAVAYSLAKKDEHLHILEDVTSLILAISPELLFANNGQDSNDVARFCRSAREADRDDYIRLSRFTLDASSWIKRYAEALIEREDKTPDNDSPQKAPAPNQEG